MPETIPTYVCSGNVDMTRVLPFLGNTELQILSAFSSIVLVGTHAVTAYLVKERVLLASRCVLLLITLLCSVFAVGRELMV